MPNKNADSISGPNGDPDAVEQAYWTMPGTSARVVYSLPLFQDIDFAVNEGYRKIPHGGIEIAALLFGSLSEGGATIEAFRRIECEHLFGPSFLLSERDLNVLEAQIQNAPSDPEVQGLQLVGWFLAHTRGPLQLTDPELELFDRFFPLPGQLTLLVKPERFQPTLFGFLVRDAEGNVRRDASQDAIILPLPGRAGRAASRSGPQPSLQAPKSGRSVPRRQAKPAAMDGFPKPDEAVFQEAQDPSAGSLDGHILESPPDQPTDDKRFEKPPDESTMTADIRAARRRLKFEEARLLADTSPTQEAPGAGDQSGAANAVSSMRKKGLKGPELLGAGVSEDPYDQSDDLSAKPAAYSSRLMLVLPLAALIGSAVGYVAYRQIPSPIISLNARGMAHAVLVSWPPAETRNAIYAAIRVDDSAPVPLSPGEKVSGQLELSATPDMKIELVTHNWLRDSRGIVRFVKADTPPPPAQVTPGVEPKF